MIEAKQYLGYARGFVGIYDDTLTQIAQVKAQNGYAGIDQHESALSYNKTASLSIIYQPERADLSAQNITEGIGWLHDSIFQKIDIASGALLFEWSAFEHVALSESVVPPNTSEVVGSGFSPELPWDYFHMNSVDENSEGDYIISARHVSALYKINGTTGSIIWRLGGTDSDFDFLPTPAEFNFSSQHDARWLEHNETHSIISLFDNASNGFNRTANASVGMIIALDHSAQPRPSATLLRSFRGPPELPDHSDSQANMQVLNPADWRNSNTFIGWGNVPAVTEHSPSGEIIYQASVEINPNGMMNYRAYKVPKAELSLTPTDAPALYTYANSQGSNSTTVYYMSWNGATNIASWRILAKQSACSEEWKEIGRATKTGFETKHRAAGFWAWGMVEALDEKGRGVKNSTLKGVKTFVPSERLSGVCGDESCEEAQAYTPFGGGDGAQVAQVREGCVATPEQLREESEAVLVAKEEREKEDASGEEGANSESEAGRTRSMSVWVAGLAAVMAVAML